MAFVLLIPPSSNADYGRPVNTIVTCQWLLLAIGDSISYY